MNRVAECFIIRKKKIKTNKRYKWFIPKALDAEISKGDIVLVRTPNRGIRDACPAMVVDILESDNQEHYPVICILEKYNGEKVKSKKESKKDKVNKKPTEKTKSKRGTRFSDKEKEAIRIKRAEGIKLKDLAEMYSCSISTIHKIVKS